MKTPDAPMKARVMHRGISLGREDVYYSRKVFFRRSKKYPWEKIKTHKVLVLDWTVAGRAELRRVLYDAITAASDAPQVSDLQITDAILAALAPTQRRSPIRKKP